MRLVQRIDRSDGSKRTVRLPRGRSIRRLPYALALASARLHALRAPYGGREARPPRPQDRLLSRRSLPHLRAALADAPVTSVYNDECGKNAARPPEDARRDLGRLRRQLQAAPRGPGVRRHGPPAGRYVLVHRVNPPAATARERLLATTPRRWRSTSLASRPRAAAADRRRRPRPDRQPALARNG